jgi:hypothetical protein
MRAQGKERVESWDRQIPFKLIVNGNLIYTYRCDFMVRYAGDRQELVEVKGYWTPEAKLKLKIFRATVLRDHPELTYQFEK